MKHFLSPLFFFVVSIKLSNGKQSRLPVTKPTSSFYFLSCGTKYSSHKTLRKNSGGGEVKALTKRGGRERKGTIKNKIIA